MSVIEAYFFPFLGAFIVLLVYLFAIIYVHYRGKNKDYVMQMRLAKVSSITASEEGELAATLLKNQPTQDPHFQSKLPKIEGLKQWIQHAGLEISPLILIAAGLTLGIGLTFVLFSVVHFPFLISALISCVFAFMTPWAVIAFLTMRRKNEFMESFPVSLDVMRRALRAGYSVDRALEMVAEQQKGMVGDIFHTVSHKMHLGEPVETVLADMSNKVGFDEFRMLSIVLVLQRETGGSLAEATENFSKIIRARQSLRKKIKALSAEVRVTAMILSAIPFFILGGVYFSSPQYLDVLFYTEKGHTLLLIGSVMLFIGITMMIRMAYKEIY